MQTDIRYTGRLRYLEVKSKGRRGVKKILQQEIEVLIKQDDVSSLEWIWRDVPLERVYEEDHDV